MSSFDPISQEHILSEVMFSLKVCVIPTPPRSQRLLWDQFHSISYPSGFFPNDILGKKIMDPLDLHGDRLHTNFYTLYEYLRERGYYLDVLHEPFTCFHGTYYSAVLIVDPEEEFFAAELSKVVLFDFCVDFRRFYWMFLRCEKVKS